MLKRRISAISLAPLDLLKVYYEGNDPERLMGNFFNISIKYGIPFKSIRGIDYDRGVIEYYNDVRIFD